MLVDLPLAELREYRPEVAEPGDFADFWSRQLAAARAHQGEPSFTKVDAKIQHAEVFDVTFPGYGGDPIKGWLLLPHRSAPHAAVIVEFIGYGGGRGLPFDWLNWSCAGHPHLVMDTRGQGGSWRSGDTADRGDGGAPSTPGFMTRGIASPHGHYYTRLFIDAARAVDAVRAHPGTAGRPVVTAGMSQGGGLTVAAAHLAGEIAAVMPDVPFLSNFRRAVEVTDSLPYYELADYCRLRPDKVEAVFATLSYLDIVNHGRRVTAPALFSVGLTDTITPPSTVFAAYNYYAGQKDIAVFQFSGHDGGGTPHFLTQLAFLANHGLA
ncbi:MAG TPA: acetylxylan esterase [Streptosporangiaceae bacterium]|nr:acetylxylan esterase [Streptosporangiaceae bacterium]